MNRRNFLSSAACATALRAAPPSRPNILFLLTDDQRFSTIGALNNSAVRTPNMDRLVRNGAAFTHAFIMGGTIPAVCVPSRAMTMTGQSLFHVHDSIVDPKPQSAKRPFVLMPEALRKAGYTTFGTGKWHNGEKLFARAFSHGGNVFFGGMADHLKTPVADFDPAGEYPRDQRRTGEKFSSELFSDTVIQFLENYKEDRPFFAYAAYTAPHDPRMAPREYRAMFPPEKIELPPNFLPEHPFDNGEMKVRDEALAPWPRTPEIVREHIAEYYAMIAHLDAQIGRVLQALESSRHAGRTIVIFAGDNGLAVGQHGLLGKQNLYDHSVRVPLVIGGPGLPKGKRSDALVYLFDIFPTVCDLTGLPIPESVEGKSLLPLIDGRAKKVRDSVFFAYRDLQRGVRTGRWKLIRYVVNGAKTTQLFDIANDPWEKNNLAADPGHTGRVAEMNKLLWKWQNDTGDKLELN